MELRQIAILIAFLILWVLSQVSHAEVIPGARPESTPSVPPISVALKSTISKIHHYVYSAYTGSFSEKNKCENGVELFDFSQWLELPMGLPPAQLCTNNGFAGMITQLAKILVIRPRELIAKDADITDLLGTNDMLLRAVKGEGYVELKEFVNKMKISPLDFTLAGEPTRLGVDSRTKLQRFAVPVQLASGLISRLENLKIKPEKVAELKTYCKVVYNMNVASAGELRLEEIKLRPDQVASR